MDFLSEKGKDRFAIGLIFVSPACFASNMLLAKAMSGTFPPMSMAVSRWLVVALFLGLVLWPQLRMHYRQILAEWKSVLVLGGLGMGLCGGPIYLAGTLTTATNIGLIYAVCPLVIVLLSVTVLGAPAKWLPISGVLAGFAGVVLILTKGQISVLAELSFNQGDVLVVMGTIAFAVYSLGLKHVPTKLPPLIRFGAMAFAGALWHLPFFFWEAVIEGQIVEMSGQIILVILTLVFVSSLGAYLSFGYIVQRLGATQAGAILFISPLYIAVLAVLLLDETLSFYHFWGMGLILPGLWLANRK